VPGTLPIVPPMKEEPREEERPVREGATPG